MIFSLSWGLRIAYKTPYYYRERCCLFRSSSALASLSRLSTDALLPRGTSSSSLLLMLSGSTMPSSLLCLPASRAGRLGGLDEDFAGAAGLTVPGGLGGVGRLVRVGRIEVLGLGLRPLAKAETAALEPVGLTALWPIMTRLTRPLIFLRRPLVLTGSGSQVVILTESNDRLHLGQWLGICLCRGPSSSPPA